MAVTQRQMNKLKALIKNSPVGREDVLNCALESCSCLVQLSKGQCDGGGLNPLSAYPHAAETAIPSTKFHCSLEKGQ